MFKWLKRSGVTLRKALGDYYIYLEAERSAGTLTTYSGILERAMAIIGDQTDLREITATDLERAVNALHKAEHSDVTHASYKRTIDVFFNWLVRRGYLAQSPADFSIDLFVRDPVDIGKAVTEEDIALLLDACLNLRDVALVTFFRDTAFRLGGAWNLRVTGIDFARREIISRERKKKRSKLHKVFMSDALCEALQAWLPERAEKVRELRFDHGYVFTRLDDGRRLKYWGLVEAMRRLGKRAGTEKSNPQSFRHAWGTWAAANGVTVPETQSQLGHESPVTTLHFYYKAPPESLRDIVNRRANGDDEDKDGDDTGEPVLV